MTRARDHAADCEWHHDQYPHECGCGAVGKEAENMSAATQQTIETAPIWQQRTYEGLLAWVKDNPEGAADAIGFLQQKVVKAARETERLVLRLEAVQAAIEAVETVLEKIDVI